MSRTLKCDDEFDLKDSIQVKCPFCRGTAMFGFIDSDDFGALLHSLPMCKKFEELPPDQFITAVRQALRN